MKAHENILMNLENEFTRSDFITKVGSETAYSLSHAQNLLDACIHEGLIDRVSHGKYRKVPQTELELH